MSPVIGVLSLQGDVREHINALTAAGAVAVPLDKAEQLAGVDALVIPGGESGVMSKLAVQAGLFPELRAAVASGMPMYGSCAGMIMLADKILDGIEGQESIGGIDMTVRRNAFGRQNESFEITMDFEGAPVEAVFIRAPWVESVGEPVQVLSMLDVAPYEGRIVAVRQGNLLATSFHPELTGDGRVHEYFVKMVQEAAR